MCKQKTYYCFFFKENAQTKHYEAKIPVCFLLPHVCVCACVIHDPPTHTRVHVLVCLWGSQQLIPGTFLGYSTLFVEVIFRLSSWLASMTVLSSHLFLGIIPPPALETPELETGQLTYPIFI